MAKTVNIKRKHKMYPLLVSLSMLLLCASVFCLYVAAFAGVMVGWEQLICMLLSSACILFFLMCTLYLFFSLFTPTVGVSLNDSGVYDYTTADKGAGFIPKEAIVSLKMFGRENKEFLGISVLPDYVESLGLSRAAKREIQNNIASGTPAVVIRQCDINVPLTKLMKLMIKRFENNEANEEIIENGNQAEIVITDEEQIDIPKETELPDVLSLDGVEETAEERMSYQKANIDLTVLTVDTSSKRAATIDEMLAELLPAKKAAAAIAHNKEEAGQVKDEPKANDYEVSFVLENLDDIAFTSDDIDDK